MAVVYAGMYHTSHIQPDLILIRSYAVPKNHLPCITYMNVGQWLLSQ